jgi:hypothetical protein
MAQPMTCDLCDGAEPAVQLHTNLEDGATTKVGLDCLPVTLTAGLAVVLRLDPNKLYDHVQRFAARERKKAAQLAGDAETLVTGKPATGAQQYAAAIDGAEPGPDAPPDIPPGITEDQAAAAAGDPS